MTMIHPSLDVVDGICRGLLPSAFDQPAAMSKNYTSGYVYVTLEGCFRALPESPEKLRGLPVKLSQPVITTLIFDVAAGIRTPNLPHARRTLYNRLRCGRN